MNVNKKYKRGICWGAWDGLHVGHLNLLRQAKERCKQLCVGISTDEYIKKVKGHDPIFTYEEREDALATYAWQFVDRSFQQDLADYSKEMAVKVMKPHVIFVGSDWLGKEWDGAKLGVPVIYLDHTDGISSTLMRKKMGLIT